MAAGRRIVFDDPAATDRIPDWASTGVVIIEWLQARGLWQEATARLKIQREGGYAGIDALLFLMFYFSSGLRVGVKEFSEETRRHHTQLAAVGDRNRLPMQASMSRVLAAVEAEQAQTFGSWLLQTAPDVGPVLNHPSVLTRDAVGEGWHVFDWDPTVTTLRHRALPVLEGTPDGRRRSESLAAPGYPGRKRGDVQFSRATLQHAGSGLWLGIEMAPGNGKLRDAFQSAIQQVVAICHQNELPQDRAILRADGAAGTVPFITACADAGMHYLTRLAHYQLLQDEAVVRHLNEAAWFEVPSSGSGPSRQAADLGRVVLEPAATSVRADGTPFDPIESRVVVSRFPTSNDGRGAGVVLDGWQYELYGTDLSPDAWPEAEVVAGYYGRTGQENRFLQEDRELGLDRIFSYHLPGQQLATLVGLFIWNFSICRGMELAHPPEQLPEQPVRDGSPLAEVTSPSPDRRALRFRYRRRKCRTLRTRRTVERPTYRGRTQLQCSNQEHKQWIGLTGCDKKSGDRDVGLGRLEAHAPQARRLAVAATRGRPVLPCQSRATVAPNRTHQGHGHSRAVQGGVGDLRRMRAPPEVHQIRRPKLSKGRAPPIAVPLR